MIILNTCKEARTRRGKETKKWVLGDDLFIDVLMLDVPIAQSFRKCAPSMS